MRDTQDLLNATVIATGEKVQVYKHKATGNYINYKDCNTMYSPDELHFN